MARNILSNIPSGPLDQYRKKASFDWKEMKIILEGEDTILYTEKIVNVLKRFSIFQPTVPLTVIDEKTLATKRIDKLVNLKLSKETSNDNRKSDILFKILYLLDPSTTLNYYHNNNNGMTVHALKKMGTKRHEKFIQETLDAKHKLSICLTEISHGSNAKAMRTKATFETSTQEFVLHTPDFEAAKCWSANLGANATFALVYAQLYTPDGQNHGLQAFLVPIRDPKTLKPYNGLLIKEMGPKASLNGVDNGIIMFNNYRIPRENLLNKLGDVTPDGTYEMTLTDQTQRFGLMLSAMMPGRKMIIHMSTVNLAKALTIAIRYSGVRKQFGPSDHSEEVSILEYQSTHYRLFPHLASCYALTIFSNHYLTDFESKPKTSDYQIEMHAIVSAGKAMVSWLARDGIQECQEVCGGHAYLKSSELNVIKNTHDANLIYDGENIVLIQQTSNWLIKCWDKLLQTGKLMPSPLKSIYFLENSQNILHSFFSAETIDEAIAPNTLLNAYKWLVCFLLKESSEKLQSLLKQGSDSFTAKNNSQIFFLKTLAVVYFEHYILEKMLEFIQNIHDQSIQKILYTLLQLYGMYSLQKHMSILYEGGYARGPNAARLIKQGILQLCEKIKHEAVSLVDSVAPHDFLITSPLGAKDGQVYQHLEKSLIGNPDFLKRPNWWQIMVEKKRKSKL